MKKVKLLKYKKKMMGNFWIEIKINKVLFIIIFIIFNNQKWKGNIPILIKIINNNIKWIFVKIKNKIIIDEMILINNI